MMEYHRAAELMLQGLGRRLGKEEARTAEGRAAALLAAVEGSVKAVEPPGIEAVLSLLRLWTGGGGASLSAPLLQVRWGRWVEPPPAPGSAEEATAVAGAGAHSPYDAVCKRLTERLLAAGKWDDAARFLLWGAWRYRGGSPPAAVEAEEAALAARLESAGAPPALRLKAALSSPCAAVRGAATASLAGHPLFDAATLAGDGLLLALAAAALLPPQERAAAAEPDHPWPLLYSPAWAVLAGAVLLHASSARRRAAPPTPLPASVAFVAARLVTGRAHLQAAALVAEARGLHPALRTAEGALSLLWSTLCGGWSAAGGGDDEEGEEETTAIWDRLRARARGVLEADETE